MTNQLIAYNGFWLFTNIKLSLSVFHGISSVQWHSKEEIVSIEFLHYTLCLAQEKAYSCRYITINGTYEFHPFKKITLSIPKKFHTLYVVRRSKSYTLNRYWVFAMVTEVLFTKKYPLPLTTPQEEISKLTYHHSSPRQRLR